MQNAEALTGEGMEEFLKGSGAIEFSRSEPGPDLRLDRASLGGPRVQAHRARSSAESCGPASFKMTGIEFASGNPADSQISGGKEWWKRWSYRRRRFPVKYTRQDVARLAEVDRAHGWLNGAATVRDHPAGTPGVRQGRICAAGRNLGGPSVQSARQRGVSQAGGEVGADAVRQWSASGSGANQNPQGRPGYLRIDTVHQGDWNGAKGVYHINAVDEVTQWQVVGCVGRISEQHLLPVLEAILHQFPFCNCGDSFGQRVGIHQSRSGQIAQRIC